MTTRGARLCLLVLAMGPPWETRASGKSPKTEIWDCGVLALYQLLRLEGRPSDLDQLRQALPGPSPKGYSLLDLRRAASVRGVRLDAVVLPKRRSAFTKPALLFVKREKEGHFMVVRPVGHTGRLVQVLDGDREPAVFDAEWLFASPSWTGLALVPHRTNYVGLAAGGLTATCLVALGFLRWSRRRAASRLEVPAVGVVS
jgi:peptidase C39-like protein